MEEYLEEDLKEDPQLGEPQVHHGIEDMELTVFNSCFKYGEEPGDEFRSNYDRCRDH